MASKTAVVAAASSPAVAEKLAAVAPLVSSVVSDAKSVVASAAASASPSSSSSSSSTGSTDQSIGGFKGLSNGRKSHGLATTPFGGSDQLAVGNIGWPQGSNIIAVSSTDGHPITNNFINTSGKTITIACWNNAGYTGTDNSTLVGDPAGNALKGTALSPTQSALTFSLGPNESQLVAFQDMTDGACSEATSTSGINMGFGTSWIELKMYLSGAGYDLSSIQNPNGNKYHATITSENLPDCTSDPTQNMWFNDNVVSGWLKDVTGVARDGSCYIPAASTIRLTTKMGGSM